MTGAIERPAAISSRFRGEVLSSFASFEFFTNPAMNFRTSGSSCLPSVSGPSNPVFAMKGQAFVTRMPEKARLSWR